MNIEYFKLAQNLNEEYKQILVKADVHFRASLNSLSMISVCGAKPELGVKCSFKNYKSGNTIRTLILDDISKINCKSPPKRPTPEKKLQSWIINFAQKNNGELPFDKNIKFITSELAIQNKAGKKIVTDILGYSETSGQLCVIELKSDRLLKRLIQQVYNFENVVNENYDFFSELLSLYDFAKQKVLSKGVKKIVVWPHEKTSPLKELKDKNILEFTYQSGYYFTSFS